MARKGNPSRSIPRRESKIKRKSSARKESERVVTERFFKRAINSMDRNAKGVVYLQGDQSKSKRRENEHNEFCAGMDQTKFPMNENQRVKYLEDAASEPIRLYKLEQERGKVYGDPFLSHQAIGLVWEGIFRNRYHMDLNHSAIMIQDIGNLFPADLVAEMLAGFKLARLSRPIYKQDSADDIHNYVSFSERFRGKKENKNESESVKENSHEK